MTWSGDAKEVGNWPCGYLGEDCSKQKEQPVQRPYRRSVPVVQGTTKGPMWLEQGKGRRAGRDDTRESGDPDLIGVLGCCNSVSGSHTLITLVSGCSSVLQQQRGGCSRKLPGQYRKVVLKDMVAMLCVPPLKLALSLPLTSPLPGALTTSLCAAFGFVPASLILP